MATEYDWLKPKYYKPGRRRKWKFFQIHAIEAGSWFEGQQMIRELKDEGKLDEAMELEFLKEDKPRGFWKTLMKQVLG